MAANTCIIRPFRQVCFIRGSLADEDGNISLQREAMIGEQLEVAEATHNSVAGNTYDPLAKAHIANKEQLTLQIIGAHDHSNDCILTKMTNLATIETIEKESDTASFRVHATEYAIPMSNAIDVEAELKKLEAELKYAQGFLKTVMGKLGNERFVQNAPEAVVAMERTKKKADAGKENQIARRKHSSLEKVVKGHTTNEIPLYRN